MKKWLEVKPDDATLFEIPDDIWEWLEMWTPLASLYKMPVEKFLRYAVADFNRIKITRHYKWNNQLRGNGIKILSASEFEL